MYPFGTNEKSDFYELWQEIKVANITIMSEGKVKLLGIYIDKRLHFDYYCISHNVTKEG